MSRFKDHFSAAASDYARFRPTYPPQLFDWLASLCPERQLALDVATGNGQAAVALAQHFEQVIASDASAAQLAQATSAANIDYRCEPAERSSLPDASVDLLVVAQALHWFDLPAFYAEAQRLLKPQGVIAVWCYGQLQGDAAINTILARYYHDIVGSFWPPERAWLEQGYARLDWPFAPLAEQREFALSVEWDLPQLLGYLGTWSATRQYQHHHGHDPRDQIDDDLRQAWGTVDRRAIRWPLSLRVGRKVADEPSR